MGSSRPNAGRTCRRGLAPLFGHLSAQDKEQLASDFEGHIFIPRRRLRPSLEAISTPATLLDWNREGHNPTPSLSTSSGINNSPGQLEWGTNFYIYLQFVDRLCYLCSHTGTGNFISLTLNNEIEHVTIKHVKHSIKFICTSCNKQYMKKHAALCHLSECQLSMYRM